MQCEPNPWGVALSEPLRESNGFMSHAVTYAIRCAHLNSSVRRGVKDFEWLLQALKLRYRSGLFIPPTNTHAMGDAKNEEKVAQQERYLTLCLAAMTRHPVLSMDELVLLFLTEKMEVWKVYRKGKRKAPEGHLHLWDAGLRDHVVVREAAQGVISVMEKGERDSEVDARVAALLSQMTVPEKARQLDIFRTADILENGKVSRAKAEKNWGDLSLGFGVLHDVYPYPALANDIMAMILNASRLKVPPLFGGEATHGLQMDDHTIFPSPITLAATWDVDLMQKYGAVVGSEARAAGITVTWAPVLGLCREPRWGRCEEMMGEDTHLAAELGRAAIGGFADGRRFNSSRAVAPLMKHYVSYSNPEGGHNTAPAHVGRREVLTTFVPPFAAGMEAGAQVCGGGGGRRGTETRQRKRQEVEAGRQTADRK